jgi:hypothetical protein
MVKLTMLRLLSALLCRSYVLLVCFSTLACSLVVLLSFIWQQAANTALLLVSPFALAGAPLVSLGFMGCNQELSEVGDCYIVLIRQLDYAVCGKPLPLYIAFQVAARLRASC